MAEFLVKMADERGRMLEQVESAHTANELRERFSQQGFLVYDIRPQTLLTVRSAGPARKRRIKLESFVIFNTQFLTLIRAGLPILSALELLGKRQQNIYFRSILENVRQQVKSGVSLSQAFESQHFASRIYTTTLLAGEKSGNLEEVLGRYIAFQRIAISFRKKLIASLIYPALLIFAMFALFGVLIIYVVPQFADLYTQLNAELPPMTAFMLGLGQGVQHWLPYAGILVILAVFAFLRWRKTSSGAETIDRFRSSIPVLGEIWMKYQISMFARMLSTLLSGGLPLVPAMETAASSMGSRLIANNVQIAGTRVREGLPLARSLEETAVFPELAIEMIEVGESTGSLPAMLTSVSEFYEEDVQTALSATLSLIEPLILVVMGTVVAFVLISLYLPIFSLGASAGAAN